MMMSEKHDGSCRALIKWAKKGPDKMARSAFDPDIIIKHLKGDQNG